MRASSLKGIATRVWLAGLIAAALAVAPQATGSAPFDRIVVFGTSLSDPGNAYRLVGGTSTPPDYSVDPFLVPGAPYALGGHHFTNGDTWVEDLGRALGLAGSVGPAFGSASRSASNYAVGAARGYNDGRNLNLGQQVDTFLQDFGGRAPAGALYAIEIGSNDVRDALLAFSQGQDGGAVLTAAIQSIAQRIQMLHAAGARRFLVWNVPDIGVTPAVRRFDAMVPGAAAIATQVTVIFNGALGTALNQLAFLPGISIARLDAFAIIQDVAANPSHFGLTNVTAACINPDVQPFKCPRPDEYLFWDGIHPSAAAHVLLANEALSALGL